MFLGTKVDSRPSGRLPGSRTYLVDGVPCCTRSPDVSLTDARSDVSLSLPPDEVRRLSPDLNVGVILRDLDPDGDYLSALHMEGGGGEAHQMRTALVAPRTLTLASTSSVVNGR